MTAPGRRQLTVHAAINGNRNHPATPKTPEDIAREARAAVDAGATLVHLHPYDEHGFETLAPLPCAEAIAAVRLACPGVPISLSTSATIVPDPIRRMAIVKSWFLLPDLVSANQGEAGITELCEMLMANGVGVEAGLLSLYDARRFVESPIALRCRRALVEPQDLYPDDAVTHAATIESLLLKSSITIEQVHHGEGIASWAVNRRAVEKGYSIRTGLEDTAVLPDGRQAPGNRELVAAAVELTQAVPLPGR